MLRIRALLCRKSRFLLQELPGWSKPGARTSTDGFGSNANAEHGGFESVTC